jgi:hypothetical protein
MHYHSKKRDRSTLDTIFLIGGFFLILYVCFLKPDDKLPYGTMDIHGFKIENKPNIQLPPSDEWFGTKPKKAASK